MGGFPTNPEESGKWKTGADDTAVECGDGIFLGRGLDWDVLVPHDGIVIYTLWTRRLLMVLVV